MEDARPRHLLEQGCPSGQVPDCVAGEALIEHMSDARLLNGEKGYDSNAMRRQIEARRVMPNIPPKANRRGQNCFSPMLHRNRNTIERMFCLLKDFRRVATRYDRLAVNFLAAFCIAATFSFSLCGLTLEPIKISSEDHINCSG